MKVSIVSLKRTARHFHKLTHKLYNIILQGWHKKYIFRIVRKVFELEYTKEQENLTTFNNLGWIIPTKEDWCSCGQCEVMSTAKKCMCCQHCGNTAGDLWEQGCINDHDQFNLQILNPDVLSIAYIYFMMFKKQQGRVPEHLSKK